MRRFGIDPASVNAILWYEQNSLAWYPMWIS